MPKSKLSLKKQAKKQTRIRIKSKRSVPSFTIAVLASLLLTGVAAFFSHQNALNSKLTAGEGQDEQVLGMTDSKATRLTQGLPSFPNSGAYSNLKASIDATANRAVFEFSNPPKLPNDDVHVVDLALDPGMNSIWWSFIAGNSSPIVDNNPKKWDEVTCGKKLYWRVHSQDNKYRSQVASVTVACPSAFTNLKSNLSETKNRAEFFYTPILPNMNSPFSIDLSTDPNMESDVYLSFAQGTEKSALQANAKQWDKFTCGKTLYWRVQSAEGLKSDIQKSTVVECAPTTPTPLPTPDPCADMVVKLQENDKAPLVDNMNITTDQRLNAVCFKRNSIEEGPIQDAKIAIANYSLNDVRWPSMVKGKAVDIAFKYGTTIVRCFRSGTLCPSQKRVSVNTATVSASFPPRVAPYSGTVNKRTGNATFKFYTRKVAPNQVEIDLFPQENSTKSGLLSVAKGKTVPETTAPGTLNIFTVTNSQALRDWPSLECNSKIYWKIRNSRTNTYVLEAYTGIINVTCD